VKILNILIDKLTPEEYEKIAEAIKMFSFDKYKFEEVE